MHYERYKRFWAVYDGAGSLVCVTVYKRGAREIVRRLAATPLENTNAPENQAAGHRVPPPSPTACRKAGTTERNPKHGRRHADYDCHGHDGLRR